MKTVAYSLMTVLLISFGMGACKKVDNNNTYLNSLPHLSLSVSYVPGIGSYTYQTSYTVGDTMTLVGVLFISKGGTSIQVGNASANIIATSELPPNSTNGPQQLDVVRFLITSDMGIGTNRPVTITANGHSIEAPPIDISQFVQLQSQTDTSLWVDSLASMVVLHPTTTTLISDISSTDNGNIYFDNSMGVFLESAGVVQKLLDTLTTYSENGTTYKATGILSCAPDHLDRFVYISMSVVENSTPVTDRKIYRLVKFDWQNKVMTTVNRTQVLNSGTNTVTPFEGSVASVPVLATQMKTDANGDLFYYNKIRNTGVGILAKNLINFCQLDSSGKIHSLITIKGSVAAPGIAIHLTSLQYASDPQGKTIYILDNATGSSATLDMNILAYNPSIQDLWYSSGSTLQNLYDFVSYDTSSLTGVPSKKTNVINGSWLALPNGDLLIQGAVPSMAAINIPAKKMYTYAGTERGVFSDMYDVNSCAYVGPRQVNTTGKAKDVRFYLQDYCALKANIPEYNFYFAGIDPHGTVYYCTVGAIVGTTNYTINFYKLYSKK